ncbi:cytolysin-like protein [Phanerochaete sordida]|uniref:Cytolysin-like protein n=1 Tax=Phanerochaete sordida TaxID=48140 RepID=A0A9P3GB45_9APHY|nr:cytolysin-like protein [Phanerochaete sordida]
MAQTKTSWEDLANLGWPINDVFIKANAKRNGTMKDKNDIHLNKSIAADYQWWSYNKLIGDPRIISSVPNSVSREEVAWVYDNMQSTRPFQDAWTETWSNTSSATVSVQASISINIYASVTIFDVASSGYDITVDLARSCAESKEASYALSHSWAIEVDPGEKMSIIRVITTTGETTEYGQKFGVTSDSMVGTEGQKYNGHYYWGYNINSLLGNPQREVNIMGVSRNVTYAFKIVRESVNGVVTTTPLHIDYRDVVSDSGEKLPAAVRERWLKIADRAVGARAVKEVVHAD